MKQKLLKTTINKYTHNLSNTQSFKPGIFKQTGVGVGGREEGNNRVSKKKVHRREIRYQNGIQLDTII